MTTPRSDFLRTLQDRGFIHQCTDFDALDRPVAWPPGADVSALSGEPVMLQFFLRDADLFSFQFSE